MISPEKIPTFTGNLADLHQEIIFLRQAAKAIGEHGGDVHTRFQRLDAFYEAPEAGQLFGTTQAVQDTSGSFADKLGTVAEALETYMVEAADIAKRLETLRGQAAVFVESVKGDDRLLESWRQDQDKVDEHQAIWDAVNAAVAAFQQAEVTCADKITALVGGTQWHVNDGSPKQENAYGFSAGQLGRAEKLPWGTPEHTEALPFGIDYHLQQTGVSLVDNAVASVTGLVDLFSTGEEGGAAREGLLRVIVGAESYLLDPRGDRDMALGPFTERFTEDSRPYAKEFAKSFVGWDDWSTNPGKAMGTVIFNGLTLGAGPLGAAAKAGSGAGKAGAAGRLAGKLAVVGDVLDPIGAAARTVGAASRALPRVADLTAGVRAATEASTAANAAHSYLEYPDGSQLRLSDGEFIPAKNGIPDRGQAPHEPAAADRAPSVYAPRERELVSSGAYRREATAHAGDDLPSQSSPEADPGSQAVGGKHQSPASDGWPSRTEGTGAAGSSQAADGAHRSAPDGTHHGVPDGGTTSPDGTPADLSHGDGGYQPGSGEEPPSPDGTSGGPPDIDPARYRKDVNDFAQARTGSMAPEQEAGVVAELSRAKMDAREQASVLRSLRKDPYGAGVAEMISRGHLRNMEGYDKLLDSCKKGPTKQEKGMVPGAYMAMRLATELQQTQGVGRIGVELDTPTFDLDVYTRNSDGSIGYGYQLKDADGVDSIKSAARKAVKQLDYEGIGHRVAVLDVHDPMTSLPPEIFNKVAFQAERSGVTFLLRFTDGSLTVPPNSPTFP